MVKCELISSVVINNQHQWVAKCTDSNGCTFRVDNDPPEYYDPTVSHYEKLETFLDICRKAESISDLF